MLDYTGQRLGSYQVVRLVGRGGFADVYLGEHVYLKTHTAIKVLQVQLADDALKKFLREARTIACLDHPHIVRVFDFGIEQMTPFLVMNYASHGTLRQCHPFGSTVPLATIVSYVRAVTDALQYAHDRRIIHRDVKPENILVGRKGSVTLSDFGLAIVAQNISNASRQNSLPPRGTAGTTTYMAPEQFDGKPCMASDQYALGVIVYEWLCGAPPFTGSDMEIALQHIRKAPPALHGRVPTLAPEIERVVLKALAKDPQQRFSGVKEFARALEEACPAALLSSPLLSSPLLSSSLLSSSLLEEEMPVSPDSSQGVLSDKFRAEDTLSSFASSFIAALPLEELASSPAQVQHNMPTKAAPSAPTAQAAPPLARSATLAGMFGGHKSGVRWVVLACLVGLIAGGILPLFASFQHASGPARIAEKTMFKAAGAAVASVQASPIVGATEPPTPTPAGAPGLLIVEPLQFNRANCVVDNSNYRCTATLVLSTLSPGNFTWNASSTGVGAKFNPFNGTITPGQSNQVIIYVTNDCALSGNFVFTGSTANVSVPWRC
jgi:serine/threonine protein kinase